MRVALAERGCRFGVPQRLLLTFIVKNARRCTLHGEDHAQHMLFRSGRLIHGFKATERVEGKIVNVCRVGYSAHTPFPSYIKFLAI
jgi:hypothetical protein